MTKTVDISLLLSDTGILECIKVVGGDGEATTIHPVLICKPVDENRKCTDEELANFRAQFSKYTNEILPPAGLVTNHGQSAANQTKRWFLKTAGVDEAKHLTFLQWKNTLQQMDSMSSSALVEAITKDV